MVRKKRPGVLQQPIDVHSVAIAVGESISSVIMWNIYCKLVKGKHNFYRDFFVPLSK